MQSIFGALLTAGYAAAVAAAIAAVADERQGHRQHRGGADQVVRRRRERRRAVPAVRRRRSSPRAKQSFLEGADWAYTAGIVAILLGAALVFFLFPKKDDEQRLLAEYQAEDAAAPGA